MRLNYKDRVCYLTIMGFGQNPAAKVIASVLKTILVDETGDDTKA